MRENFLLDTSLTGSPFHTLRALLWNVRTLGPWWWTICFLKNALRLSVGLARGLSRTLWVPAAAAHAALVVDGRGRD